MLISYENELYSYPPKYVILIYQSKTIFIPREWFRPIRIIISNSAFFQNLIRIQYGFFCAHIINVKLHNRYIVLTARIFLILTKSKNHTVTHHYISVRVCPVFIFRIKSKSAIKRFLIKLYCFIIIRQVKSYLIVLVVVRLLKCYEYKILSMRYYTRLLNKRKVFFDNYCIMQTVYNRQ